MISIHSAGENWSPQTCSHSFSLCTLRMMATLRRKKVRIDNHGTCSLGEGIQRWEWPWWWSHACVGVFGCLECSSVGLALNWNHVCGRACCFLTGSPVPRGAGGRARCQTSALQRLGPFCVCWNWASWHSVWGEVGFKAPQMQSGEVGGCGGVVDCVVFSCCSMKQPRQSERKWSDS